MSHTVVSSRPAIGVAASVGLGQADPAHTDPVMARTFSCRSQPSGIEPRQSEFGSVAILLCTYNGARFLPLQLASFEAQDFTDWRLFVSDDGSHDETPTLLAEFQAKHGAEKVQFRRGPAKGFVANFMSLICDSALKFDYYALSDQDDIWASDKISRARTFLMKGPDHVPSVYCSRASMIDEHGAEIGFTPLYKKPPNFRNALVQNIAIGNTMAFNEAARSLLIQAGSDVNAAVHDWWIYLATTAVGGRFFFDPIPSVAYRIHARNLIGSTESRVRRFETLLKRFKFWNDLNVRALERIQDSMLQQNKMAFEHFRRSRNARLLPRLYGLLRSGIYRETMLENIELAFAALVGQI